MTAAGRYRYTREKWATPRGMDGVWRRRREQSKMKQHCCMPLSEDPRPEQKKDTQQGGGKVMAAECCFLIYKYMHVSIYVCVFILWLYFHEPLSDLCLESDGLNSPYATNYFKVFYKSCHIWHCKQNKWLIWGRPQLMIVNEFCLLWIMCLRKPLSTNAGFLYT